VANQYTAQMMQEVKDAVFGNVGSIISFRTSADDARIMLKYFEPKFEEHDLVHMHNRHFAISMTIEGEKVPAFSAISLNLPPFNADYSAQIIEYSRSRYAQSRATIERYVSEHYLIEEQPPAAQAKRPPMPQAKPQPKPQPKPIEPKPQPKEVTPTVSPVVTLSQAVLGHVAPPPVPTEEPPAAPKRKRSRRRKKKTADGKAVSGPTPAQIERAIELEEGVIHLK